MWLPRMATNAWLLLAFALIAVKISSASALDCYACTSQELLACGSLHFQANQTSLPSVTCETNANACITRVSPAGYIERGCASTPETESCSGSDCSTCNGNNCNGQRFPLSGGLNCLQCAGDSCDSDFEQQAYPCPLHRENDACYTAFSKDGQTIFRGCVAADLQTPGGQLCTALGSLCVRCSRDGCNNAKPIIQDNPLKCIKCDSSIDPTCSIDASKLPESCDTIANGQTDACFVHVRNGTVARGCLSENFGLEEDCRRVDGAHCSLCTTDGCNQKAIESERCVRCDSESDVNCIRAEGFPASGTSVECPLSANVLGCYRFEDADSNGAAGAIVKRGCMSDLHDAEADMCAHGSARNGCKRCMGENCNSKPHFQTCRTCTTADNLRCYVDANDDRVPLVSCASYTDECFIHVANNTVTRGCLAETSALVIGECADPAKCERCDGSEDCNVKAIGANDRCYTCDSRTNANCRDQVDESMIEQCAFSVNALGCFRAEDADGHIRRGCLNSVANATEVANCQSQSNTCKTCSEPFCNAKPTFQRCRVCDSSQNSNCVRSPNSFVSQVCPNYTDECYVHAEHDVITRGCMSKASAEIRKECESDSDEFCRTCESGASCNNWIVDGEFCYECDSETGVDCGQKANHTMHKQCPLSVGRRGCYLFDDGGIVKRGCLADLSSDERSYCRNHRWQNDCKTCLGDDCNAKRTFQTCRTCNSTEDLNCVRSPHVTRAVLCHSYDDECFVHVKNSVVTRGCLQMHGNVEQKLDCAELPNDVCETCEATGTCNQRLVDGEFCLTCDSETDPDCRDKPDTRMHTQCPLSPIQRGCYRLQDDNGRVRRGCVADLETDEEIEECRAEGSRCKACLGNDCNAKVEFQRCRTCNSTENVNCIRSPNSFSSVVCTQYMDECFTHVDDNNVVVRGCLAHAQLPVKYDCYAGNPGNAEKCSTCSTGPSCNNRVVDGEFCLTCNSETDPDCGSRANYTMRTQCPLSPEPVGCYLFDDGGGIVKRGCLDDLSATERDYCRNHLSQNDCKSCLGNDCNAKQSFQVCRTCSSIDTVDCIRAAHVTKTEQCDDYDDECFVHVRDNIVTRGCLQKHGNDEQKRDCGEHGSDVCETCEATGTCNAKLVDGEFCLTCDSATDPNCRDQLNHTMRTQCPLSPSPRGCYRLQSDDGHVQRGCVADLSDVKIDECRLEGDNCKTCIGNDCNARVAFQQCRVCSSVDSVNCIRSPGAYAPRTCRNYTDECFTHVENNIVTRGCLAESTTALAVREECSNGDGDMCGSCSGSVCNNKVVDGEFCLSCDSALDPNCLGASLNYTLREQCPLALFPRGCYLQDLGDGNVTRGCVGELTEPERQTCRSQGDHCKTCLGDDCNAKPTFEFCRKCSSSDNVNCIRSAGSFASQSCRSYMDSCYSLVVDNVVTRGCVSEAILPQVADHCFVALPDNEFCGTCSGSRGCNTNLVDGEFCLSCDSLTDNNCRSNANYTMRTQCPLAAQRRGCYRHEYADGRVERGCVADMPDEAHVAECRKQGDACKTCIGDDCNQQADFLRCKQCTSASDPECVRQPSFMGSQTCRAYTDQCYVHVHNNTVTRGCMGGVPAESIVQSECANGGGEFCATCAGKADCNMLVVDGEFCLECDAENDDRCARSPDWTMRKQCDLSVERRGCYLYDDHGGLVKRGCLSGLHTDEVNFCRRESGECKTCKGNDCNAKVAFQTCHVCDSSTNVNCIRSPGSFAARTCRNYDDTCYAHVLDDKVTRGCLASAPEAVKQTCASANGTLCEQCTGPQCNNKLVDGEFCMRCDSRTDAKCRNEPDHTLHVQCPLSVNVRGCYRSESSDGHVQRGCVADWTPAEEAQCTANSKTCKVCQGNDCNAKVHFQSCKVCNSTENVDCIRSAAGSAAATQLCDAYADECFVHVKDDVVVRGCLAQQSKQLVDDCTTNPDLCETCHGGICNTKIVDGEFCLKCDSTNDPNCRLQMSTGMHAQCSLAVSPLGCYHYADESSIVRRGCISDLSVERKDACRSDNDHCKICNGNDCNKRPEFPRCITCDSTTNPHCAAPTTNSTITLDCDDYSDSCFTQLNGMHVRRGCVATVAGIRAECERDEANCRICASGNCNQINVEPESCYGCDSKQPNTDCAVVGDNQKQLCSNDTNLSFDRRGCYHSIIAAKDGSSEHIRRGCVAHLAQAQREQCTKQMECKTCQGDDCNARSEFQRCYKCGLFDDGNCADNSSALTMLSGDCNQYENSCSTYILVGGNTVRGCTNDLRIANEVDRIDCSDNECNGLVYPADRLRCHQCSGADCSDAQSATAATACRNYRPDDQCYGYMDANNHMQRGCLSDTDAQRQRCDGNATDVECTKCTSSGCNGQASFVEPTLSCIQCADAAACEWGHLPEEARACRLPVPFGRHEECYTFTTAAGTQRGCLNDIQSLPEVSCPVNTKCTVCETDACNTHNARRQVCQVCNGEQQCDSKSVVTGFATECESALYSERGCYTRNNGSTISRGCAVSLTPAQRIECSESSSCSLCLLSDCNTSPAPNSGVMMRGISAITMAVTLWFAVSCATMV